MILKSFSVFLMPTLMFLISSLMFLMVFLMSSLMFLMVSLMGLRFLMMFLMIYVWFDSHTCQISAFYMSLKASRTPLKMDDIAGG